MDNMRRNGEGTENAKYSVIESCNPIIRLKYVRINCKIIAKYLPGSVWYI
jgi:hypothetical protein